MHAAARQPVPGQVLRLASGRAPSAAPPVVHEVLRTGGRPLPDAVRHEMQDRLGHNFADVRIHTDDRSDESARLIGAHAYTLGRHIVFAGGRFDPWSLPGRRLLAHELTHAAGSPPLTPVPSGTLQISSPADPGERHAERIAGADHGAHQAHQRHPGTAAGMLMRQAQQARAVEMKDLTVNHDRVTVPPERPLSFSATVNPASATSIAFSLHGTGTVIAPGTTIDNRTRKISVDAAQTGGAAEVVAKQTLAGPHGAQTEITATAPFNFAAIPVAIVGTTGVLSNLADFYGGDFTHTFSAPSGSAAAAIDRAHVNEKFPGSTGRHVAVHGTLGSLNVKINDPDLPGDGWDLDAAGTMTGVDNVTWPHSDINVRPFVVNASNKAPAHKLPLDLLATQGFRNLSFPSRRYAPAPFTSTPHRRAVEDRSGLKAVTSSNAKEVVEDYAGPAVFRHCRATPASVQATKTGPPGGMAPTPSTTTVSVDVEGENATPTFSIQGPSLGSTIDAATGVLTVGTTPGSLTVRAGVTANFDEATVTITPPPAAPPPSTAPPARP